MKLKELSVNNGKGLVQRISHKQRVTSHPGNWTLWRTTARLAHRTLVVPIGLAALWFLPIILGHGADNEAPAYLLAYGEILLPVLLSGITAGIVFNDPMRELWLVAPYPFWRMVRLRLGFVIVSAALAWAVLLLGTVALGRLAGEGVWHLFIGGITTCYALGALGFWAALRLHSKLSGGMLVAALWAGALIFRKELLAFPTVLFHPFLTFEAPTSEWWLVNRLLLACVALLCTWSGLRLARHEEALLPSASDDTEEGA